MSARPTLTDRVIKAEAWIEGHELRCEERYSAIQLAVADLRHALNGWRRGAWALVAAVLSLAAAIIGSLLVQVYDLEPLRVGAAVGDGQSAAASGQDRASGLRN